MNIPEDLKYTKEHEWARKDGDVVVIGITDHAQEQLGDIVFVELPEPGAQITKEETFGTVESVKAVSDLFAPISGEVTESNEALADKPEVVNSDPYGEAWMVKVKPADAAEVDGLLSAADYEALVESEG
jgi:glycine cleavage system H protein